MLLVAATPPLIPAATASLACRSFGAIVITSVGISVGTGIDALYISNYHDIARGPAILLTGAAVLLVLAAAMADFVAGAIQLSTGTWPSIIDDGITIVLERPTGEAAVAAQPVAGASRAVRLSVRAASDGSCQRAARFAQDESRRCGDDVNIATGRECEGLESRRNRCRCGWYV